jgi:hypothetical protein
MPSRKWGTMKGQPPLVLKRNPVFGQLIPQARIVSDSQTTVPC